ncbi:Aminopeptidase N [Mariniflexile rhizosphaerae]|uniref:M1 family metallopeptidase n=1 Tax=unclassified Mariniflexile TaxID=2643887 RepID=UPI000CCA1B7F|nr:M1 family metallopeptidase [Mariniflexile sp. TRM1-10]AXP82350.1 Aminopeptidase N [Mariniflexile sp. TRM1-10]PLB20450.1 MAG: Peptidase M1 family protein [Flavobacteriaceae bacterium FS1-H7996/R]
MKRFLIIILLLFTSGLQAQQTDYVDFKTAKADIVFGDLSKKEVGGTIVYEFEVLKSTDSIYIDAVNFSEIKYVLDGRIKGELYDGKHLIIKHPFKLNTHHRIDVTWKAKPTKAMYFVDWGYEEGNKQIWTQGQGKYTSNWLPSIDDMNDKIEFDLSITFHKDYDVIANGKLTNHQINNSTITWHYNMQQPMSSYLVALAIGKYHKNTELSKSGIPLEMYYYPEDSLKFEPTYRYTKQLFDFLEEEIGVPYPWQNYKQVPVKDFLYAGMENTSTTIFADSFVIDSIAFVDKNYVNVNAHELAHQWFGDLVTETSGTHHWLQEGFATYYALLAERDVFGDAYYYWQLYQYAQELLEQDKVGQGTSLLDPKSSSITFYKKGAWVLHMLREQVGDKAFKTAIKNYLEKHQFKNVETDDFIVEVEKASGQDLDEFVKVWLESDIFQYEKCINSLSKNSKQMSKMIELDQELLFSSHSPDYNVDRYFDKATSLQLKAYLFSKDMITIVHDSIIKKALNTKDIKVRQALAINKTEIPSELKADFETLLNDESYLTIEKALFNLWLNFPQERNKYLSKTRDIQGFNDKNVRILWLTLALITEDFEPENKNRYFEELTDYTDPIYGFEIRQNAFLYLQEIKACKEACAENLKQAASHHSWQFSKFAKSLLEVIDSN